MNQLNEFCMWKLCVAPQVMSKCQNDNGTQLKFKAFIELTQIIAKWAKLTTNSGACDVEFECKMWIVNETSIKLYGTIVATGERVPRKFPESVNSKHRYLLSCVCVCVFSVSFLSFIRPAHRLYCFRRLFLTFFFLSLFSVLLPFETVFFFQSAYVAVYCSMCVSVC